MICLPLLFLAQGVTTSSRFYLGHYGNRDICVEIIEAQYLDEGPHLHDISLKFENIVRTYTGDIIMNTKTIELGDSFNTCFCVGDFLGGEKIPQVFVTCTLNATFSYLFKYDGYKVYKLMDFGKTGLTAWPVQLNSGAYVEKVRFYPDLTEDEYEAIKKGAPRPVVNLVITGKQIMKWWKIHKTPFDPTY